MTNNTNVWEPTTLLQTSADSKRVEENLVATANQQFFSLTTFTYTPLTGSLAVYKNGILLRKSIDWVEVNSTSFSLTSPAALNDDVAAVGFTAITGTILGAALVSAPTSEFMDSSASINTENKAAAVARVDSTTNLLMVATGNLALDAWQPSDGSAEITPS